MARRGVKFISANERFCRGDPITNPELEGLHEAYQELADTLTELGPDFYLARMEATRRLTRLDDYMLARGLMK